MLKGAPRIVVGKHVDILGDNDAADSQCGSKACDVQDFFMDMRLLEDIAPVLHLALMHDSKERAENMVRLPQFDPAEFDLFVRMATMDQMATADQETKFYSLLTIDVMLKILPIAAYLRSQRILKTMIKMQQASPNLSGVVSMEQLDVEVTWSKYALDKLAKQIVTKAGVTQYNWGNGKLLFSKGDPIKKQWSSNSSLNGFISGGWSNYKEHPITVKP